MWPRTLLSWVLDGDTLHSIMALPNPLPMILLHAGSGSWEIQLLGDHLPGQEWMQLLENVRRLLKARKRPGVGLLERLPWELREGTNFFGDEFCLLYAKLPIERYVAEAELEHNQAARDAAKSIVNAFDEIGTSLRFVAFEPDVESTPSTVPLPEIRTTAAVVSRALNDAERLLQTSGPVSAVDRVHTALQGYLRELCQEANLDSASGESMTGLWKRLRAEHPAFSQQTSQDSHLVRVASGIATILDALNPIRNSGSVAHPNDDLLTDTDAMLAVNAARTILHFVGARVRR